METPMKRIFLITPLTAAVLLLSGCPDTKLPTPTPKVPAPKAQTTTLYSLPGASAENRNLNATTASIHS